MKTNRPWCCFHTDWSQTDFGHAPEGYQVKLVLPLVMQYLTPSVRLMWLLLMVVMLVVVVVGVGVMVLELLTCLRSLWLRVNNSSEFMRHYELNFLYDFRAICRENHHCFHHEMSRKLFKCNAVSTLHIKNVFCLVKLCAGTRYESPVQNNIAFWLGVCTFFFIQPVGPGTHIFFVFFFL